MIIAEIIISLILWFVSGQAVEKIYMKAGFIDTPKFIFWIPGLNIAFLTYLAFAKWPAFERSEEC